MSSGTWTPGVEKDRVGLYNRFISLASARVNSVQKGVVGIPVIADWGPDNKIVFCENDTDLITTFGTGGTVSLARRAMKGGKQYKPYRIVVYRMTTDSAKQATANINGLVELKAKYKGIRGNDFRSVVSINIKDSDKVDIKLYENSTLIKTYTCNKDDVDEFITSVNATSDLIIAEKIKDGTFSVASDVVFKDGDSGSMVTNDNYIQALNAFESAYLNTLALDGVSDSSLLETVKSWHKRVWDSGKLIQLVIGGSHTDDKDPSVGNIRSRSCDNYGVINCIVGGIDSSGNQYSSAEMAPQIAGTIAALPLNKAITYKEFEDITDVTVVLSNTQISDATKAGSFVLIRDINPEDMSVSVKVERGINTFTTFTADAGNKLRKIKAISTMSAIDYDIGKYAAKNILGEIDNDSDGQAYLFSGVKIYLETLVNEKVISPDIFVNLSEVLSSTDDIVYMDTQALTIDKIEQVFNTIYL